MKIQIRKKAFLKLFFVVLLGGASVSVHAGEINKNLRLENQLLNQPLNISLKTNYAPTLFNSYKTYPLFGSQQFFNKEGKVYKRKSPFLASALNFVLPGAGYLYNGDKHPLICVGMMAGAVGLTYVELDLQKSEPDLYPIMFGSVFVLNTSIAIDTFFKTKKRNEAHNL